jgi:hypothetical protein
MIAFLSEIVLFALFVIFCFYLPGKFFITRLKVKPQPNEDLFVAPVTGIVFFTFLLYILAWVHLDWMSIPVLLVIDVLCIRENKKRFRSLPQAYLLSIGFIAVCSLIFSTPLLLMGIYGNKIVYHVDDLWHLSLIQELKANFPPNIPDFAGVQLRGYHFFYNFLLGKISSLFFFSPLSLHFHLFPLLLALLWGLGVYTLMYAWSKKVSASLIAVFLTIFGGSFAYILSLQGHPEVSLSDGLGMLQPASSIYNPPFTISVVILLFCLFLLYRYLQTREKQWLIPMALAAGILPMFKVYAGIILFGGLLVVVALELLKKRFFPLAMLLVIGVIFLGTYEVFVGGTGGLIWHPFWPPHELLRGFSWYGYDEKIYTFSRLHVIRGLVQTESYGFNLFLFGNLGTRIFGILCLPLLLFKKPSWLNSFTVSLVVMTLISVLIPLLFIQTGKVFEIIQMANYYLLFCSLFAALGLSALLSLRFPFRSVVMIILSIIFLVLTLPSAFNTYNDTVESAKETFDLTQPYYQALFFLRERGSYNQTVLELPSRNIRPTVNDIHYWYANSNPAVSAFSDKRMYLANMGADFPGMDTSARFRDISQLLNYRDNPSRKKAKKVGALLKRNKIVYIFSPYSVASLLSIKDMRKIYHNTYFVYQFSPAER